MCMHDDAAQAAFWEGIWRSADPRRLAELAARLDRADDPIARYLTDRGARRVCDAGCGCGAYARKLARRGFSVSGFDLSADAAALAQAQLIEVGHSDGVFLTADIRKTPYPDGCFDAVVARDVLDHMSLTDAAAALRELLRITRPGGCVVLTLDALDADYEAQPHAISPDGDYLFTQGKWAGMVFHPYRAEDVQTLTQGGPFEILNTVGGLTVAVEKE